MNDPVESDTSVQIVLGQDLKAENKPLERHPGLIFKELVGPDSPLPSAGPIIGVYEATIQDGRHYWPQANERDVDRIIYIQHGSGHLHIGEDKHMLKAGDLVRLHQGEDKECRIECSGEERLKILIIIFELHENA